jgi:GNAT superfamily N-acetyltransferase
VRIEHISEHVEQIETVARWQFGEWGHLEPGDSLAGRVAYLGRQAANPGRIPATFIAIEGDEPLGSASVVENDMDTHPELTPWLASVYVKPEARGRGVGSALVRRVIDEVAGLGVSRLYLFTESARGLYEQLGWHEIGAENFQGLDVTIMAVDLQSEERGVIAIRRGRRRDR